MSAKHRRRFWVDAPLQLQIIGLIVAMVVSSVLLVDVSVLRGISQAAAATSQIIFSLDWVRQILLGPILISSAVAILACGLIALVWSHRMAGPLRVLSAAFARLKDGDLSVVVKVRETDAHQDLVHEFAAAQHHLRNSVAATKKHLEKLSRKLEGSPSSEELNHIAEELKQALSDLRT